MCEDLKCALSTDTLQKLPASVTCHSLILSCHVIHISFLFLPDNLISPERRHPVRNHAHGGQLEPKTRERRAAAGF